MTTTLPTAIRIFERELGKVEASHSRAASLDDFEPYRDRPVAFIREVLDGDPWEVQREIAGAVLTDRRVAVATCNSLGKDWLAARLALWWVYARRGRVLVTGPTERQVKEVVMRSEVRPAFTSTPRLPGDLYETALRVEGTGGIIGMTSADASKLTGFHHPAGVLVLITEAQGVENLVFEAAAANTTGKEDAILAVGNPLAPVGRFFDITRRQRWRTFKVSAFDHPNVVEDREVIPGAVTRAWIEYMRAEYGETSPVYRSRVLAEWPEEGEDSIILRAWLEAAAERWEEWRTRRREEGEGGLAVGVDVGRRVDATVVGVRRGSVLAELHRYPPRGDLMEMVGRLVADLPRISTDHDAGRENPPEGGMWQPGQDPPQGRPGRLVVDEGGLGGGFVDRLRELLSEKRWGLSWALEDFNAARSPTGPDAERYLNRRAQAYWNLRTLLQRGKVAVPEHEKLWEELLATEYRLTSSGKIQIVEKDELRVTLGRSPDFADATAFAFLPSRPRPSVRFSQPRI